MTHSAIIAEDLVPSLLAEGYRVQMRVAGDSMTPNIRNGAVVIVEPASAEALKIGDVILYQRSDDTLVLHRLLRRTRAGTFICGGDATARLDDPVPRGALLGRRVKEHHARGRLCANGFRSGLMDGLADRAWAARKWQRVIIHYAAARVVRTLRYA